MSIEREQIKKAIHKSQHCQRNWDLDSTIPQEDLDVMIEATTQCPSKQNVAYYKVHLITNRELIEKIHDNTNGFTLNYETGESTTNSQVLANLLVVFEGNDLLESAEKDPNRNFETKTLLEGSEQARELLTRDKNMAVGIAAGYLNLTASLLGYATGCCACFDSVAVKELLGLKGEALLLMGVGIKNENLGRRVHHTNHDFVFPTKPKQEIQVHMIS